MNHIGNHNIFIIFLKSKFFVINTGNFQSFKKIKKYEFFFYNNPFNLLSPSSRLAIRLFVHHEIRSEIYIYIYIFNGNLHQKAEQYKRNVPKSKQNRIKKMGLRPPSNKIAKRQRKNKKNALGPPQDYCGSLCCMKVWIWVF